VVLEKIVGGEEDGWFPAAILAPPRALLVGDEK